MVSRGEDRFLFFGDELRHRAGLIGRCHFPRPPSPGHARVNFPSSRRSPTGRLLGRWRQDHSYLRVDPLFQRLNFAHLERSRHPTPCVEQSQPERTRHQQAQQPISYNSFSFVFSSVLGMRRRAPSAGTGRRTAALRSSAFSMHVRENPLWSRRVPWKQTFHFGTPQAHRAFLIAGTGELPRTVWSGADAYFTRSRDSEGN